MHDDELNEDDEFFTVTLSNANAPLAGGGATLTVTGTITDDDVDVDDAAGTPQPNSPQSNSLQLSALQVTGGGTMYPAFDADTYHYALTCNNATTLQVTAAAKGSGASLTLLAANPVDNHQAVGNLDVQVSVNADHDVVIELSDAGETAMYIVHCQPSDFPEITILNKLDGVSEGLLFVGTRGPQVGSYGALIDYNGTELFRWNSWDHMDVEPDCLMVEKYLRGRTEYAHVNSVQIADGDIIASFRGCAQVLRIDRSSGAVEWKLGGIAPGPDSTHTYT